MTDQITSCPAPAFTDGIVRKAPKFADELKENHHLNSKIYEQEPHLHSFVERKITGEKILEDAKHLIEDLIEEGIDALKPDHPFDFLNLGDKKTRENDDLEPRSQPPQVQQNFIPLQFSGFANTPVVYPMTGETMKSSSRVFMNPGYSLMPYPVCFVSQPQQYRPFQQFYYPQMVPIPMMHTQPGGNEQNGSLIAPEFIRQNG